MKFFTALALVALVVFLGALIYFRMVESQHGPEVGTGVLAECPDSPNCFSATENFRLQKDSAVKAIFAVLEDSKEMTMETTFGDYIHATSNSSLIGFVDDVEIKVEESPLATNVSFRSASRVGRFDFGVNKKRIEALIGTLRDSIE